jgi:hypothetical protein
MSSLLSSYASYFTQASRYLGSNVNNNFSSEKVNQDLTFSISLNENTLNLLKKFVGYSLFSAAVAGSAFYIGFHYAKRRDRFNYRIREESKNEQVKTNE